MKAVVRSESGYVLVMALVFLSILGALVMEELHNHTQHVKMLTAYRQQKIVLEAAEEALQHAEQEIVRLPLSQWPVWYRSDDWHRATASELCNRGGLCATRIEPQHNPKSCLPMASDLWRSPKIWSLAPVRRFNRQKMSVLTRRIIELRCYMSRPSDATLSHRLPYFRVSVLAQAHHMAVILQSTVTKSVNGKHRVQRRSWLRLL